MACLLEQVVEAASQLTSTRVLCTPRQIVSDAVGDTFLKQRMSRDELKLLMTKLDPNCPADQIGEAFFSIHPDGGANILMQDFLDWASCTECNQSVGIARVAS